MGDNSGGGISNHEGLASIPYQRPRQHPHAVVDGVFPVEGIVDLC